VTNHPRGYSQCRFCIKDPGRMLVKGLSTLCIKRVTCYPLSSSVSSSTLTTPPSSTSPPLPLLLYLSSVLFFSTHHLLFPRLFLSKFSPPPPIRPFTFSCWISHSGLCSCSFEFPLFLDCDSPPPHSDVFFPLPPQCRPRYVATLLVVSICFFLI